ncbi:hypothetical protein B1F74_24860 [Pseudomonas syringae]|nr:hypothetical protein B1F74_24860 [Pseudomonas syringae]
MLYMCMTEVVFRFIVDRRPAIPNRCSKNSTKPYVVTFDIKNFNIFFAFINSDQGTGYRDNPLAWWGTICRMLKL